MPGMSAVMAFSPTCGVCQTVSGASGADDPHFVMDNELWHVRHAGPPFGVPGWMMLMTRRHVAGPAHFDDVEAASFGPTLRHLQRVLEQTTGALRIYTAAMGESHPHFHAHMVPRTPQMPKDAKAWAVFDLQRAAGAGELTVDAAEVTAAVDRYRAALRADPPPAPR